ncbi:hypothetical protein ACSSZE_15055 [Acidithiobacillus caldus]|jgi:hypothetical protein
MLKSVQTVNSVLRAPRQIRDWLWWLVLLAFIEVLTVWILTPLVNLQAWLTPDGADALAAVTMLLLTGAVTALGASCYLGIFAEIAKWLHLEEKAFGRAIIAAADASDISSSYDAAQFIGRCRSAIRRARRRSPYAELGAVGNVKAALAHSQSVTKGHRGQGRQAGAAPATRSKASGKSAEDEGDGGGDGEPPRQLFYTYTSFSKLFGVAPQTLRNKVSAGLFLAPVQTVFGPRFTQQHIDFALNPPKQADVSPPPGRGRPRIARGLGKGGAQ